MLQLYWNLEVIDVCGCCLLAWKVSDYCELGARAVKDIIRRDGIDDASVSSQPEPKVRCAGMKVQVGFASVRRRRM